ncbi:MULTISPECIES: hypothetical protein [Mycobacteroides]|uniref:hypothetical protein n=1 Tax=Mycobacteroides TaxID=670516 RepID=UPI000992B79A|nr:MULTISPECIES: hypothetical protein [Mycobacteroides]
MRGLTESWHTLRASARALRAWPVLLGFASRSVLWSTGIVVLAYAIATYALNSIDSWVAGTLAGGLWLSVTLLVLPTIMLENVGGLVGIAIALDHFRHNWARCLLGSALLTVTSVALMSAGLGLLLLKPESSGLMLLLSILALIFLLPAVVYALALILVYQTVLYRELVATHPT